MFGAQKMRIKDHTIRTPHLWLGHDIKQGVKVWEHLPDCPGIMLNAYHLTQRKWFVRKAKRSGLASALNYSGPVFLDSGGFLFQNTSRKMISPQLIIDIWHTVKPHLAVVLDIPLNPIVSNSTNAKRWYKTLQNTEYMHKNNGFVELCPVIHTYSLAAVEKRCYQLRQIIPSPRIICIGSMVPLIQGRYLGGRYSSSPRQSSATQRWQFMGRLIRKVRKAFPNALIHVFGAGSLSSMYLLYLLGADSLDSTAWRIKAAYGEIQLRGTPNRWISGVRNGSHRRKGLGNSDMRLLAQCECPACVGKSLECRFQELRRCYRLRAIHNAHTFVSEVDLIRSAKMVGHLVPFTQERLRFSPKFLRILNDAVLPILDENS